MLSLQSTTATDATPVSPELRSLVGKILQLAVDNCNQGSDYLHTGGYSPSSCEIEVILSSDDVPEATASTVTPTAINDYMNVINQLKQLLPQIKNDLASNTEPSQLADKYAKLIGCGQPSSQGGYAQGN